MSRRTIFLLAGLLVVIALIALFFRMGDRARKPSVTGTATEQGGHQHAAPAADQQQAQTGTPPEAPTVEIPVDKQRLIGVKSVTAAVLPLRKTIRTVGRIEYDEKKLFTLNAKVDGWVEKLHHSYTGQQVKKGEPLVEIYSPELFSTQQELLSLIRWTKNTEGSTGQARGESARQVGSMVIRDAEALVDAARQRLRLWDISDEQIKKIEESGKPARTLIIYSPASGYILQKYVVQGQKVMAGEKLFDVADLSTVWVTADIYESDLPLVKVGDTATIQLSYLQGRAFNSRIDYIYPTLSGETRTAKARFTVSNEGLILKPQMFTNVELKVNLGQRLAIPEDAVIDTGMRQIVYVQKEDGAFEPREVALGLRGEKMVEVRSGLKAGDKVAAAATFLVDSEAKLKGVEPLKAGK
jgi:membrane fusion protein, copper/silver efflux system